jgi:hypothetical protein
MPGGDGMGPTGQGSMMGGGRGRCGGAARRMDLAQGGLGLGRGRGAGWRHRRWLHATGLTGWQGAQMGMPGQGAGSTAAPSKEQELALLKQQARSLERTLGELVARIQEIAKPVPDAAEKEHE